MPVKRSEESMKGLQAQAANAFAHWSNIAAWAEKEGNLSQAYHARTAAKALLNFAEGN